MRRWVSLVAWLLLSGTARGADFAPVAITAAPLWVRYLVGSAAAGSTVIEAPAGQTPTTLSGMVTAGDFAASATASVSAAADSVTLLLSGSASAFNATGADQLRVELGDTSEIAFQAPSSAQSVVQVFFDWTVSVSPGWRAEAVASAIGPEVEGLGSIGAFLSAGADAPAVNYLVPLVGTATVPAGEVLRLRPSIALLLEATDRVTGAFSATATLRFRVASPLPLGDSNADGVADLVDVVILRRRLAGQLVP
jgi:hypothetical protein